MSPVLNISVVTLRMSSRRVTLLRRFGLIVQGYLLRMNLKKMRPTFLKCMWMNAGLRIKSVSVERRDDAEYRPRNHRGDWSVRMAVTRFANTEPSPKNSPCNNSNQLTSAVVFDELMLLFKYLRAAVVPFQPSPCPCYLPPSFFFVRPHLVAGKENLLSSPLFPISFFLFRTQPLPFLPSSSWGYASPALFFS